MVIGPTWGADREQYGQVQRLPDVRGLSQQGPARSSGRKGWPQ